MSKLIVEVTPVLEIQNHPNADRLDILRVKGWQVIASKLPDGSSRYKVGDLVIYIPPDAVLTPELAEKLEVTNYCSTVKNPITGGIKGYKVKGIRLRGEPSYGLLMANDGHSEGDDVSEVFNITKWEPPPSHSEDGAPLHPLFHRYSDPEHYQNYPDTFPEGTRVVITEKIHGCLIYSTPITMADGTKKHIDKIEVGDIVLGMKNNQIVPTKVLNKFNNGSCESGGWLEIKTERRAAGKGNSFASIKCTPNHRFWIPSKNEYIEAENLRQDDEILIIRNDIELTPIQEQILIGKMLGDGSFQDTKTTASISFGHKKEHEEYVDWTLRGLGEMAGNKQKEKVSGFGTNMCCARTISNIWIKEKFKNWLNNDGQKIVPKNIIKDIGPIALAFWYMDDGSLSHHEDQEDRACFAVCGFDKQSCENIILALEKFDIHSILYESDGYNRIRLNANDAEKLFLLIAPYVPSIMQYKLPERYRGHIGWLPNFDNCYKPAMVKQKIIEINRSLSFNSSKWDIETETHNFFANEILVHNSNGRAGMIFSDEKWELMAGSHNFPRKEFGVQTGSRSIYWAGVTEDTKKLLNDIVEGKTSLPKPNASVILFHEIYGLGMQDMHYGKDEVTFAVFDIAIDGNYVPWAQAEKILEEYKIPTVPVLFVGEHSSTVVKTLTDGPTLMCEAAIAGAFKGREGVVVKPYDTELVHPRWRWRVILKSVSADYLARKGGTDSH